MTKSNTSIRVLILSDEIFSRNGYTDWNYEPPFDVDLDIGRPNQDNFNFSIFDYDVTIVHIEKPRHTTTEYYENLPKIYRDARIALEHGRTIICLPESDNFTSKNGHYDGMAAYEWTAKLGLELQDNIGVNIKPSGAGQASVFAEYLQSVKKYYQIVKKPTPSPISTLAVVDGTTIVVGVEHKVDRGNLVILPPPVLDKTQYHLALSRLMEVARRYHERAQRKIPVGDSPTWLDAMLPSAAQSLNKEIEKLRAQKSKYDEIAYVTYGTGKELENAVALLLADLGLRVDPQPNGANIDLKAKHPESGLGFAFEVTGTKGTIQKDSDKISQSWQYLSERAGTSEEEDRLIIVANTQYHLDPAQRRSDSFSAPVVKLLGSNNGVLLLTTLQLYALWKDVHEQQLNAGNVIKRLHESAGLFHI